MKLSPQTSHITTWDQYANLYADRVIGMKASEVRALFAVASRPEVVSLAGGMPFTEALPMDEIAELVAKVIRERGAQALQYGEGAGLYSLRESLCTIMEYESIKAYPDDIVVTVGSQQALDMIARLFLNPGDHILAEGPSYVGALGVFAQAQSKVVHIPLDNDGVITDLLEEKLISLQTEGIQPKFFYCVPNFHNPAGVTLSLERRRKLIDIADRFNLLIIEDNPYGLLGFDHSPLPSLYSMNPNRVIYLGSTSKLFAGGMRTGWVVAPYTVRSKLTMISESQILCPSMFTQHILNEYFKNFPWQEQVKTFASIYHERRDAMLGALSEVMPAGITWTQPQGGFYVWVTLPENIDSAAMVPRSLSHLVAYVPGTGFYANGGGAHQIRLSYCYPPPERIIEGIDRLAMTLQEEMNLRFVPSSGNRIKIA